MLQKAKPNRKSQSALEYMMTYGWAILIIVIVAGVLYSLGIFTPSSSIGTTITGFNGLGSVTAQCYANGLLRIQLGNSVGNVINITKIVAINTATGQSASFTGSSALDPSPEISPSSSYIFSIANICPPAGQKYSLNINVTYTAPGQTLSGPYFSTGLVSGVASSGGLPAYVAVFSVASLPSLKTTSGVLNFPKTTSITLVAWINVENELPGGANAQFEPVGLGNSSSLDYVGGALRFAPYGLQMVRGSAQSANLNPFINGVWYQAVGIYNYSGNATSIFENGIFGGGGNAGSGLIGTDNVFIGSFLNSYVTPVMLFNVQVYTVALTSSQILNLYKQGPLSGPITSGIFGWWPLNGTAKDYSGNGNNGVASNVVYTSNYPAP